MKKNNCETLLEGDRVWIICRQNLKSFSLTIAFFYAIVWDCVQCGKSTTYILFSLTRKECFAQNLKTQRSWIQLLNVMGFALYMLGNLVRLGHWAFRKANVRREDKMKTSAGSISILFRIGFSKFAEKKFSYTILKTLLYLYLLFLWDQ